ncbi:DUF397 domain-containing protein [Streptomyces sp. NPDC093109]|uniref:DUF397 domain-containing protein n=1 Tax=Streptomyces sp. NPDC093109 TaxID=3154977 RepID=UPI00344BF49D
MRHGPQRTPRWRKSSYSNNDGGMCVEVDDANPGTVRDSKNRTGPSVRFEPGAWQVFVTATAAEAFGA